MVLLYLFIWFFIVYLPKKMETEKWPKATDPPLFHFEIYYLEVMFYVLIISTPFMFCSAKFESRSESWSELESGFLFELIPELHFRYWRYFSLNPQIPLKVIMSVDWIHRQTDEKLKIKIQNIYFHQKGRIITFFFWFQSLYLLTFSPCDKKVKISSEGMEWINFLSFHAYDKGSSRSCKAYQISMR